MSESNGHCTPWIGDGYDCDLTIPALAGRWPETKVKFRPLSADEESLVFYRHNKLGVPLGTAYADALASKILGWNITDRNGRAVEINAKNIGALSPQFFDVLRSYIDGTNLLPSGEPAGEADQKN